MTWWPAELHTDCTGSRDSSLQNLLLSMVLYLLDNTVRTTYSPQVKAEGRQEGWQWRRLSTAPSVHCPRSIAGDPLTAAPVIQPHDTPRHARPRTIPVHVWMDGDEPCWTLDGLDHSERLPLLARTLHPLPLRESERHW